MESDKGLIPFDQKRKKNSGMRKNGKKECCDWLLSLMINRIIFFSWWQPWLDRVEKHDWTKENREIKKI